MSQSAENQSAIIENENNFNIAMESQAAEPESSHASECLEGIPPTADFEPGTPTQDETEQRPDVDQAVRSDVGDGDGADNNDTGEEVTAGAEDTDLKGEQMQTHPQEETGQTQPLNEPSESQEASELRSHSPAEGQDQETGAEAAEVDEPELAGNNYDKGRENDYNEPEVTDEAQVDKTDQQHLGENEESEPVSSQVEPGYSEAEVDSSVIEPNSEVQEDQGMATDDVEMEERELHPAETVEEDQNPSAKNDSGTVDEDLNHEMGGSAEDHVGESVASQEDQNQAVEDAEKQQVEDQNLPMEGIQPDESGTADEDQNQGDIGVPDNDQNLPVEEPGQPAESEASQEDQNLPTEETGDWGDSEQDKNIPVEEGGQSVEHEQDQDPPMEENIGQWDESEQNQNLPMEDTEQLDYPQQDQILPTEDTEQLDYPQQDQHLPMEGTEHQAEEDQNTVKGDTEQLEELDQNVATESAEEQKFCETGTPCEDENLSVEDAEDAKNIANDVENQIWEEMDQSQHVENDRPEDDQQMLETEQDQQPESERAQDVQTLAANETEADQQDEIIDEDMLLAEEPSQDKEKADGDSHYLDSENQNVEEASVCQPDASVTEDTPDTKASVENSDPEAGLQEDISTNEGLDSGKVKETEETGNEAEQTWNKLTASGDAEAAEVDQETTTASQLSTTQSDSKSTDGLEKLIEDTELALDPEADRASDVTIVEGRDIDDEPMLQVTDIKSGADAEEKLDDKQESAGDVNSEETCMDTSVKEETAEKVSDLAGEPELTDSQASADTSTKADGEKKPTGDAAEDDDDDVVVLDDEGEVSSQEDQKDPKKEVLNSNNDMGIQIESVSGGANDVHGTNERSDVRQVDAQQKSNQGSTAAGKTSAKGNAPPVKKSRTQTCVVCKKIGKCKYNIVRNGDIKHLCDEACFKRFRENPSVFLKGAGGGSSTPAAEKKSSDGKASAAAPAAQGLSKPSVPGVKTCTVCLLMNLNTQGQFCIWKGLDFCGEGCLGKFQSGISSSCALCSSFIPLASRPTHCLRIGDQMRPFCSSRCLADYKLRLRLCTQCQKDAASAPDAFFSAPVGSDGSFKDFCSQTCMKKFEELLNTDVEIIRVEAGKPYSVSKCSVCLKKEMIKHTIKYKGNIHSLCGDACVSAFQYANKLDIKTCEFCSALCTSRESSLHTVQFEGHQKQFCSDDCVTKFRLNNRKVSPCSWCGTQRDNFDMIERLDSASKYQLFCSLNCLSLYRVNLQAKSNQPVCCDQCTKRAPAQYHLTMSDASVRNFCSYNCVMTFQAQFSKGPPSSHPPSSSPSSTPAAQPPPPKTSSRGRPRRGRQQSAAASPSFPIISNVISLAPQGGQQVNIKNSTGMPVVVSGAAQGVKTSGTAAQGPVQQQIIIQPPPPKPVKNKSIMCKPFAQTKGTSCRPHTQSKDCQTDEVQQKPVMVPVPVPVYLPAPMSLYSAPAPTPVFVPIPIPVPIFIPTTRKSANGILKQIKEIREKTPSDPLEAELLMMAAAVSADGKNSSDSESEEEMLPEITRPRKRLLQADDDDDNDVMPLTSNAKEEEGGEEDMISMALRMAEEMSGPITDLESAVEAVPVNTEPPPQPPRPITPDTMVQEEEMIRNRRGGGKRWGGTARRGGGTGRPAKRPRLQVPQPEVVPIRQEPPPPPPPPADANYHLKFTYGVNAWRHWVLFKNNQIERNIKPGCGRVKLFKTDIMQCTADELNFSLCLFVKEVRKPNGEEYSADSIYYLCLGIQQYLFENGRIDNIFTDFYYERFTECLTQILSKCQPKFNASGQMVCRIEEEHLWECKQLGAHSPYVLLNTLIYFHTKYFMLKTPEDHMKLSFAHILKYWKKGQPGKGGQPARSVSLRYYSVSTAKKDGSAPTSATKKGSKDGIPVYEVTENQENPLRCPVKLYEFYLSKCPESIKNRSDIFYPVPERSCVPDSPVWYSTMPISTDVMTKMLTRILLVREIQEAHLHAQPIYV